MKSVTLYIFDFNKFKTLFYSSSFFLAAQAAKELFTGWAGTGPKAEQKLAVAKNGLIFAGTVLFIHFAGDYMAI
jgi:hypothetical protein